MRINCRFPGDANAKSRRGKKIEIYRLLCQYYIIAYEMRIVLYAKPYNSMLFKRLSRVQTTMAGDVNVVLSYIRISSGLVECREDALLEPRFDPLPFRPFGDIRPEFVQKLISQDAYDSLQFFPGDLQRYILFLSVHLRSSHMYIDTNSVGSNFPTDP